MKIMPLAADSMGSRSMATYVETAKRTLLIDPGATLGQLRYGLAPHTLEEFQLKKHLDRIELYAESAQIIILTQYTREHFNPDSLEIYKDKVIFAKNPNKHIKHRERSNAFSLLNHLTGCSKEIFYAEDRQFKIGTLTLSFSAPSQIGSGEQAVFPIAVAISENDSCFVFSSERMGILSEDFYSFIKQHNPDTVYFDGPAAYIKEGDDDLANWQLFKEQMDKMLSASQIKHLIIDHHFARDKHWLERLAALQVIGREWGTEVTSAAEFRGVQPDPLESRRPMLFETDAATV